MDLTQTTAPTPTKQMVVFSIADELFAADIGAIREVIRLGNLTPVPGAAQAIAGITNLRGRIVPVMELGVLLHIGHRTASEAYVLLVETEDNGLVGMIVDEVLGIRRFELDEIKPAPKVLESKVSADFVAGAILPKVATNSESAMLLIDIGATITRTVATMLGQLTEDQAETGNPKEAE